MTIYGYARVSTKLQAKDGNSLKVQKEELIQNGATKILEESYTGTKLHRHVLGDLLNRLNEGDQVIVTKLNRIARNVRDGLDIIDTILNKKCSIRILNMGTFDDYPAGKLSVLRLLIGFLFIKRPERLKGEQIYENILLCKRVYYRTVQVWLQHC